MKKLFLLMVVASLLISGAAFAEECPPAEIPEFDDSVDIDDYTVTYTKPWMVNFHLTSLEQIEDGYYGGECGQKAYCLAVAPSNPDRIMLGTDTEGAWLSTNGGVSWNCVSESLGNIGLSNIIFDPDNENIAFVTGNPMSSATSSKEKVTPQSGVWKTEDGAKTWKKVLDAGFGKYYSTYLFAYGDKNAAGKRKLYVISNYYGLFESEDNGESWTCLGLENELVRCIRLVDNSKLVVSGNFGVMVSEDNGKSWIKKNNGLTELQINSIDVDPADSKHWYCVTLNNLFESTDAGESWKNIGDAVSIGVDKGRGIWKVSFGPPDKDGKAILYVRASMLQYPLRYSLDYGKSFEKPVVHNDLAFIRDNWGYDAEPYATHPTNPNIMWVSLDGEIYKSTDGGKNLYPSASGYSGMRAANFWFNPENENDFYIACTDRGLIRSIHTGRGEEYPAMYYYPNEDRFPNVRYSGAKSSKAVIVDPKNPKRILQCIGKWDARSVIKESVDGGLNWYDIPETDGCNTKFMSFNISNPNTIYAGQFISYDDGKTWEKTSMVISAMSPVNGNVVYSVNGTQIYKSKDQGKTWETLNVAAIAGPQRITCDDVNEDKIYIGTLNTGMRIIDGNSMTVVGKENGLMPTADGKIPIMFIDQNPNNPLHLVAGGSDAIKGEITAGLFESYDGGKTFRVVDGIEGGKDIWVLKFHPTLTKVFIGTSSGTYIYDYSKYFEYKDTYYTDIDDSKYRSEIISLYDDGILNRRTDGYFRPNEGMTRHDFAEMLVKLCSLKRTTDISLFADLTPRHRSFVYAQALANNGLITGGGGARFCPDEEITYEQAALMFAKLLNAKRKGVEITAADIASAMQYEPSDGMKYAIAKCVKSKIIDFDFRASEKAKNEDIAHMIFMLKKTI